MTGAPSSDEAWNKSTYAYAPVHDHILLGLSWMKLS